MIVLHVQLDHAHLRHPYAKFYGQSSRFVPPATAYGMLLSFVGEEDMHLHEGVKLGFAYSRVPDVAPTMHLHSRLKYGQMNKQEGKGNMPVFVESACGLDFLLAVDSAEEKASLRLEVLARMAIEEPEKIDRFGILSLGTSDNIVNEVSIAKPCGRWMPLVPDLRGDIDLCTFVQHNVKGMKTGRAGRSFQMAQFRLEHEGDPQPFTADWFRPERLMPIRG